MEIKAFESWLFADKVAEAGRATMEFVEQKPYMKDGKERGQCFHFIGECGTEAGDYRCFPSAIKNLKELIKLLGSDDSTWTGKRFSVVATTDKKKLVFALI